MDNNLNWSNHTDQMTPKLSRKCYVAGSMFHIRNIDTLITIYFAYFNSIMKYSIIFWGNLSNSKPIFTTHKRAVGIMVGTSTRNSFRCLRLNIFPFPCKYVFSLMGFFITRNVF